MLYRVGADLVLFAHFLFAAFAVFGGLLVIYESAWAWVHIPVVLWSSVVNLMSWTCPLTPIENAFRTRAGQLGYAGGFVQHYIGRVVYPPWHAASVGAGGRCVHRGRQCAGLRDRSRLGWTVICCLR